eukprot:CAMPEP_0181331456 /NCGR_PEP_ID=MMETSP1101-20121128/24509_1 /TAXON_ID=46948 /ORGANISM="Rhodomonas abbreviata, Strain Caron Lab Isolate" /LENGTH=113 /DNA_ID=CAMNT_0023440913 /DNA_START=477 /DNA_END=815 /DNA_ORIENTATION=-
MRRSSTARNTGKLSSAPGAEQSVIDVRRKLSWQPRCRVGDLVPGLNISVRLQAPASRSITLQHSTSPPHITPAEAQTAAPARLRFTPCADAMLTSQACSPPPRASAGHGERHV